MKISERKKQLKKRLTILIVLIAVLLAVLIALVTKNTGRRRTQDSSGNVVNRDESTGSGISEDSYSESGKSSAASLLRNSSSLDSATAEVSSGAAAEESSLESEEEALSSASGREALPIEDQELVTTDMSVDWRLVLVNPTHKLPDDFEVETSVIRYTNDEDRVFDSRAVDALDEMLSDCRDAGYDPVLRASYRTWETQEYLFERKIGQYLDDGYSQSEAEEIAATIVAVPGTSEHQLGLAADIASQSSHSLTAAEADTPVQQWLMEHCVDYGFILRFPDGKSDYTGIIYEPWHYRYVGKEYAKAITDSGMCLEEYLAANGIGN